MPYLDTAWIFIHALHKPIGPRHPLYRRIVFPVALRADPNAVIYETDDERWNPIIKRIGDRIFGSPRAVSSKVGRNDACPCGSGNKYKKCCGAS